MPDRGVLVVERPEHVDRAPGAVDARQLSPVPLRARLAGVRQRRRQQVVQIAEVVIDHAGREAARLRYRPRGGAAEPIGHEAEQGRVEDPATGVSNVHRPDAVGREVRFEPRASSGR